MASKKDTGISGGRCLAASADIQRTVDELWTSRQRQMHSLHYAVSYRASFKPELPDFFIRRYTSPGDVVLDPFLGRGTTVLQANLLGRAGWGNDVNPLSVLITHAKTHPVSINEIQSRLDGMSLGANVDMTNYSTFCPFYHEDTYRELLNLRSSISTRATDVDRFIEMVAISRLHGHSKGFFSTYSFPQISVSPQAQERINRSRRNTPDYRAVKPRILAKARKILQDGQIDAIREASASNLLTCDDVRSMDSIPSGVAKLIVTSPPFLDKADYLQDNWLELWFAGIDPMSFAQDMIRTPNLETWKTFMSRAMLEMNRTLASNGVCVIEVGDVSSRGETVNLDEVIVALALELDHSHTEFTLAPEEILINQQEFTKLANCFGVDNNAKGTNTNRMVVLRKR